MAYNLDDSPLNPSPNELTREHPLCDGTHIIFPFKPVASTDSEESSKGPPILTSMETHSDESSKDPLSFDSDGLAIVKGLPSDKLTYFDGSTIDLTKVPTVSTLTDTDGKMIDPAAEASPTSWFSQHATSPIKISSQRRHAAANPVYTGESAFNLCTKEHIKEEVPRRERHYH